MTELLIPELNAVGLQLNAKKTKILHDDVECIDDDVDIAEMYGEFFEVLQSDASHRYLGRKLNLFINRRDIEFQNRIQQAWFAFKKHEKILLNKHVSLRQRLQYFGMCISPCLLFALSAFPISKSQLEQMDVLQRKILKRIIGWRRDENEN